MPDIKYKLVANDLRNMIINEDFAPRSKFFTEEALCVRYNASRQTIRKALSLLQEEKILESRRGSGTFVLDFAASRPRSMVIGIVTTYISEYIFPSLLRGMESVFSDNDYKINICATQNLVKTEKSILENFLKMDIDGLIVEGTKTVFPNPNIPLYRQVIRAGIPIVFINSGYPELNDLVSVCMDDRSGGKEAMRHLLDMGHKRIMGIFKSDDIQGVHRYCGYWEGLQQAELDFDDENIFWYTTENKDLLFQASSLERILACVKRCTACVCYNDLIAIQLIKLLVKNGVSVPEDFSIISFDNSLYSNYAGIPITSLNHAKEEMGQIAARKLVNILNKQVETSAVLPWEMVERESVYRRTEESD